MEALLGLARGEWGSLRDYALWAGASEAVLTRLEERLVEE
jgi:hypothetical protein